MSTTTDVFMAKLEKYHYFLVEKYAFTGAMPSPYQMKHLHRLSCTVTVHKCPKQYSP